MSGSPESSVYGDRALTREEYYARIEVANAPMQHPDIIDESGAPVVLTPTESAIGTTALIRFADVDDDNKESWMKVAICRGVGPSEFFPNDGAGVELAKNVCHRCEVASDCLEYALDKRIEHGVWGGASERERRRILRRRRQASP